MKIIQPRPSHCGRFRRGFTPEEQRDRDCAPMRGAATVWRVTAAALTRGVAAMVAIAIWDGGAALGEAPKIANRRDLMARLASQTAEMARRERVGVLVETLATGDIVYESNADQLFTPASNTKLFTCALALERLGPEHRLKTVVRSSKVPDSDGRLEGDLVIEGAGDPGFVRKGEGPFWTSVEGLAAAIVSAGVKKVEGSMVADSTAFRGPPWGGGWAWDDLDGEWAPQATALSVNDNVVRLRAFAGTNGTVPEVKLDGASEWQEAASPSALTVENHLVLGGRGSDSILFFDRWPGSRNLVVTGSLPPGATRTEWVSLPAPSEAFGRLLKRALAAKGVEVTGPVRTSGPRMVADVAGGSAAVKLTEVASAPIAELIRGTLKPSQNLHAQLLLLAVGRAAEIAPSEAERTQTPARTTEAAGLRALTEFLKLAGVPPAGVWLEEGAGLSRRNLISPRATAALLRFMACGAHSKEWLEALPVGGVDGTLKARFTTGPGKGNVRAKTGTLAFVNALSGYVTTAGGETLVFSVLANNCTGEGAGERVRREMDRLVTVLAAYEGAIAPTNMPPATIPSKP
jgi:serine-type D-Ala-D-Ala carboxypeptidase/endopeptidase (penicillin-binding protein 4)